MADHLDKQADRLFALVGEAIDEDGMGYDRGDEPRAVAERNVEKLSGNLSDEISAEDGINTDDLEIQLAAAVDDVTDAMTVLRSEIIAGSAPRNFEVYSQLAAARISAITEISKMRAIKRKAGQDERKVKVAERKVAIGEAKGKPVAGGAEGQPGIPMTGRQMLEFAQSAVALHQESMAKKTVVVEATTVNP